MKRLLSYIAIGCVTWTGALQAADCPVEKYTFQDVERLKFSKSLALSVIDTMDSAHQDNNNKSFGLDAIVKAVPVKINYADAKSVSDYVKTTNNYNFSSNEELDYLRTNLSIVGAQMYDDCLKRRTKEFAVLVPPNVYNADEFFITLHWTPQGLVAPDAGKAHVQVLNATVDKIDQQMAANELAIFVITRKNRTENVSIIPTIDHRGNGEDPAIVLPPIIEPKLETVLHTWPGPGEKFMRTCSDDGGGSCGEGAKLDSHCIDRSPKGLLLPSTASIEKQTVGGAVVQLDKEASDGSKVCVQWGLAGKYNANPLDPKMGGFGQRGYAAVENVTLKVWELVPSQ
jgi:hypothetical protein